VLIAARMSEAHEPIHNPHDKLFKSVFGRPQNAAALIRALLPPEVIQELRIDTIRPEPASTVGATLRERSPDLVFSIRQRCNHDRLYVVLEHKSAPERATAYAVDRYSVDVADRQVRQHPRVPGLPMVISIVMHHGSIRWNAPRALHELYRGTAKLRAALHRYFHGSEFFLFDVALDSDQALRQRGMNALATLASWVMANARTSTSIAADLYRVLDLFQRVFAEPGGTEDVVTLVRYILDVTDVSPEALDYFFNRAFGHRAQEISMITTGERLRQEGREQGLEQGLERGLLQSRQRLLMQLKHRFGALPHDVIQRVSTADTKALDTWALRLLDASTLDQVFATARMGNG
jgi:hypothetical protein